MFKNLCRNSVRSTLFLISGFMLPSANAAFEPLYDESAMDLTADPCTDFSQYACGAWDARTVIPGDKSRWSRSFNTIAEENLITNRKILEDFAAGKNLNLASNSRKLGDFYGACLRPQKNVRRYAKQFLVPEMTQIRSLTSQPDSVARLAAYLQKRGVDVFMSFSAQQDLMDSSKMIAVLDQDGLGLPSKDYYFDQANATIREKYLSHIAKMFELTGMHADQALSTAKNVMDFETALAEKALLPVEQRDPQNIYHIKTLAELKQLAPNINWGLYFSALGSPKFDQLNVAVPDFFVNLSELLAKTPSAQIMSYLTWHVISEFSSDLGGEFEKEHFEFYGKVLKGQKEITPRWKYCLNEVDSSLNDALGEAFVNQNFGQESKNKALEVLAALQKSYEKNLNEMDWMDLATRQYAIKKLKAIVKKIGYPDKWQDISSLKITKNHMANVVASAQFNKKLNLDKIGKPVDRTEWDMTAPTVNAYYNPSNNEIVFPAGILQTPIFGVNSFLAGNFGAFGVVVGHEITHGFDDEGRQYDLMGNLKDWWTPGIDKIFEQKAQCLVDQYSQYTVAGGVHLNGKLTLGENIADLGGMKMALSALEAELPVTLTEEERNAEKKKFFISYGQIWCSKATPEFEKFAASTDPHSPPKFRINGVVTNTPEFAKVFGCQEGKPLAPVNRCAVW